MIFAYPAVSQNPAANHFILGEKEGDGQLISPRQVREGPDGNIYVYDEAGAFIKIYSADGQYLRRIGGRGQGPGEIQRADGVNFGFTREGRLYFTEFFGGHPWITIMDSSGNYLRTVHIEISGVFGVRNSCPLDDGGFLIELWLGSRPEAQKDYFLYRYPQIMLRVDSQGKVLSQIISTNNFKTISSHGDGADQWLPFIPAFAWTLLKNQSIVYSDGLGRNLKAYDLTGRLIGDIKTSLPEPEEVKGKDVDEWRSLREENTRDKAWFNKYGRVIDKYRTSVYDRKPNIGGISLTPNGNMLIASPWKQGAKTKYWIIDENGTTLTNVALDLTGLSIHEHFIFINMLDSEENDLIVCIKRTGDEGVDLLRVKEVLKYLCAPGLPYQNR